MTRPLRRVRPLQEVAYAGGLFLLGAYGLWAKHLHALGEDAGGLPLHHVPACFLCALMICASFILTALVACRASGAAGEEGQASLALGKQIGGILITACLLSAWWMPGAAF